MWEEGSSTGPSPYAVRLRPRSASRSIPAAAAAYSAGSQCLRAAPLGRMWGTSPARVPAPLLPNPPLSEPGSARRRGPSSETAAATVATAQRREHGEGAAIAHGQRRQEPRVTPAQLQRPRTAAPVAAYAQQTPSQAPELQRLQNGHAGGGVVVGRSAPPASQQASSGRPRTAAPRLASPTAAASPGDGIVSYTTSPPRSRLAQYLLNVAMSVPARPSASSSARPISGPSRSPTGESPRPPRPSAAVFPHQERATGKPKHSHPLSSQQSTSFPPPQENLGHNASGVNTKVPSSSGGQVPFQGCSTTCLVDFHIPSEGSGDHGATDSLPSDSAAGLTASMAAAAAAAAAAPPPPTAAPTGRSSTLHHEDGERSKTNPRSPRQQQQQQHIKTTTLVQDVPSLSNSGWTARSSSGSSSSFSGGVGGGGQRTCTGSTTTPVASASPIAQGPQASPAKPTPRATPSSPPLAPNGATPTGATPVPWERLLAGGGGGALQHTASPLHSSSSLAASGALTSISAAGSQSLVRQGSMQLRSFSSGAWGGVRGSRWDPARALVLLGVYIRVKLFVSKWRKRRSTHASADVVDCALQRYDSTEWIHIFELTGFVLDGAAAVVADECEELFLHLSTTHLYVRHSTMDGRFIRLADIIAITPVSHGGIRVSFVDEQGAAAAAAAAAATAAGKERAAQHRVPSHSHQALSFFHTAAGTDVAAGGGARQVKSPLQKFIANNASSAVAAASSPGASQHLTIFSDDSAIIAIHIFEFQTRILRAYATTLSSSLRVRAMRVLHIAHFNDVYHLPPFRPPHSKGLAGGAARFHTVLNEMRKTVNPLVLFSGDFMGPSLMSVITKGKHMVDALNFLGVRYGCFGNHEFDYGLPILKEVIHGYTKGKHIYPGSQTTWIMSNMTEADGTPLGGAKPYEICVWQGVTVGLLGLCENWLPQCANLRPSEAAYHDIFEAGERLARELRAKGAEIVLALTHNRYALDKELMDRCPSIDYLLGGHDHFYKNDRAHRLIKSGQEFEYLSQLEIQFPPNEKPRIKIACHPITFDIEESDYMRGLIERYDAKMTEKLGKIIGKSNISLDSTEETVRFREGHLTNFILDVIQQAFHTDFAILGAAAIAGKDIKPPGNITMGDVFEWFPNETKIMVVRMKGTTIRKTLDVMVRELPQEAPSFPHPSKQLTFTINLICKPPVCQDIYVNGEPLENDRWYSVAVEDFVGTGKAKYKHVAQEAEVVLDDDDAQQVVLLVLDFFQNAQQQQNGESLELTTRDAALRNVTRVAASAAHIGVDMDMEKSQKFIRSLICELMHCDRSSIFLVDFESDMLHFIPDGSSNEIRFPKHLGLAGYVCTSGNPINIDDVYTDPRFNQDIDKKTGYRTRSMLACPVILDGVNCCAVVQAINKDEDRNGGHFDDVDMMMLRLLGEQVGFQLMNQSIFQRAQRQGSVRRQALAIFKRMASDIDETVEMALRTHTKHAREVIKCDAVKLLVLTDDPTELLTMEEGLDDDETAVFMACERGTMVDDTLRSGEVFINNDLAHTKRPVFTKSVDVTLGSYKNAMLCPLKSTSAGVLGLVMWADKKPGGFTEEDRAIGAVFAELAAVALQNAKRLEVLTQASQESALVSVPAEPLGRIRVRGGWRTIAKFIRRCREIKRAAMLPTTVHSLFTIGDPAKLLVDGPSPSVSGAAATTTPFGIGPSTSAAAAASGLALDPLGSSSILASSLLRKASSMADSGSLLKRGSLTSSTSHRGRSNV